MNVCFPADYKRFLLSTNGGTPTPHSLEIPETDHGAYVAFLYAIKNEDAISDLQYELKDLSSRMTGKLPEGFIVIGHDPGDNKFLLGTRGEYQGQVWFWDIVGLMSTTSPTENTYWLADSFSDFLNALRD